MWVKKGPIFTHGDDVTIISSQGATKKGFSEQQQLPNKRGFLSSVQFHLRAPITTQQWNSDKPGAAAITIFGGGGL